MVFIIPNPPSVIVTMWCGLHLCLGCRLGGGSPSDPEMHRKTQQRAAKETMKLKTIMSCLAIHT